MPTGALFQRFCVLQLKPLTRHRRCWNLQRQLKHAQSPQQGCVQHPRPLLRPPLDHYFNPLNFFSTSTSVTNIEKMIWSSLSVRVEVGDPGTVTLFPHPLRQPWAPGLRPLLGCGASLFPCIHLFQGFPHDLPNACLLSTTSTLQHSVWSLLHFSWLAPLDPLQNHQWPQSPSSCSPLS